MGYKFVNILRKRDRKERPMCRSEALWAGESLKNGRDGKLTDPADFLYRTFYFME